MFSFQVKTTQAYILQLLLLSYTVLHSMTCVMLRCPTSENANGECKRIDYLPTAPCNRVDRVVEVSNSDCIYCADMVTWDLTMYLLT